MFRDNFAISNSHITYLIVWSKMPCPPHHSYPGHGPPTVHEYAQSHAQEDCKNKYDATKFSARRLRGPESRKRDKNNATAILSQLLPVSRIGLLHLSG